MNKYAIIKQELDSNPGLYGSLSDQQVADELNIKDKSLNRTSMTGSEVWENTDPAQFQQLTDANKNQWLSLCSIDRINPYGPAVSVAVGIYTGITGNTISNLQAARIDTVSRAAIIGLSYVGVGDVTTARAQ